MVSTTSWNFYLVIFTMYGFHSDQSVAWSRFHSPDQNTRSSLRLFPTAGKQITHGPTWTWCDYEQGGGNAKLRPAKTGETVSYEKFDDWLHYSSS